jgi:hypothetical protein
LLILSAFIGVPFDKLRTGIGGSKTVSRESWVVIRLLVLIRVYLCSSVVSLLVSLGALGGSIIGLPLCPSCPLWFSC